MPDLDAPEPKPAPPAIDKATLAAAAELGRHVRLFLRSNPDARSVSLADESTPQIPKAVLLQLELRVRSNADHSGDHPAAAIDVSEDGRVVTLRLDGIPAT
jgi:hypothetical protein